MINNSIQVETPQELIMLVAPLNERQYKGDYQAYIRTFYSKEQLLPKVKYLYENIEDILLKPAFETYQYDWELYIVHSLKVALMEGGYYEAAAEIFQNLTTYHLDSISKYELDNEKNEIDCKYSILFIVLETIVQFKAYGEVNPEVLALWSMISTDALNGAIIYPVEPSYLLDYEEDGRYDFCYSLPSKPDFVDVYIDIIKILKKIDLAEHKYNDHILSCLKMIYNHLHLFYLENGTKFLLYIEKLQAVTRESSIPSELVYLYRLFCESKLQGEDMGFSDLKMTKKQTKRFIQAFDYAVDWCIANKFSTPLQVFWEEIYYDENDNHFEIIKHCYNKLFTLDSNVASDIIDRYIHFKRLFDKKEYKIIAELYMRGLADRSRFYFEVAYSLSECGYIQEAIMVYEKAIAEDKGTSAIYNNLGVIYAKSENDEKAMECYGKALELDSEYITAKNNLNIIKSRLKKKKEKPKKLTETYFKNTNRWHKKLLFTIYKFGEQPITIEELAKATKQKESYVEKNIDEMIKMEILHDYSGMYKIDPTIEKLVADYVDPKLERQIIQVDRMNLYRPIFFHESEINLYQVLLELFPQHFVFPNISLKTIVDVEKLRDLISSDHMNYLFMAHVDFAIISTSTYVPVIAIEKDSNYHDTELAAKKDEMKNTIFKMSGIPLIRIRFNKGMTSEKLKQEIRSATKEMILDIQKDEGGNCRLLEEIDVRNFGVSIHSDIDLDMLQNVWNRIVGEGIAKKSKVIDVKKNEEFHVSISSDLETIIDFSKEQITTKIKEVIPTIKELVVLYY
ncbi:DUF2726 domain-containing protein (plasmid) [Brevibacillus halotolerans]|nr:DUF2726 domain-containing protein [Brevibacillus halotolerans]